MPSRPSMRLPCVLGLFWLAFAVPASADPPTIAGIKPFGAQRGVAADVVFSGANLGGNAALIAPFRFEMGAAKAAEDGTSLTVPLTVAADATPGVYVVRLRGEQGVSNPFLFAVGQVAQTLEVEPNTKFEQAQAVPVPGVVEGEVAGNDVDYFKFSGKKGQRIVVDAQCARIGSGVDPTIRLTTAARKYVASDDDSPGLMTDARLAVELPEDGEYVVEISDSRYQGQARAVYRLLLGEVPTAAEVFPLGGRRGETIGLELRGGTLVGTQVAAAVMDAPPGVGRYRPRVVAAGGEIELPGALAVGDTAELREPADDKAGPLKAPVPAVLNGRLDPQGDSDTFMLVGLTPGQKVRVAVEAFGFASGVDAVLQVLGPDGAQVAQGDDSELVLANKGQANATKVTSPDAVVEVAVPPNATTLSLVVRDLSGRGGPGYPYRVVVSESKPTFELEPQASEVNVPRGGWINIPVNVARLGVNGPITLKVADAPSGLVVREGVVPEGQAIGVLSLSATPESGFEPGELTIIGEAAGPVVVAAEKPVVFAQLQGFPTNLTTLRTVAAAAVPAGPLAINTPAEPIEVVHGYGANVPLSVTRGADAAGALEVEGLAVPGGLTVAKATIAEAANDGAIAVNAAAEAPIGPLAVAFTAKGKIAGADRTFSVPVAKVNVVRPATLALAMTAVEIKPGQTVEVVGKVERKAPFQQDVTVKLEGLPAGVSAEPIVLAGGASDFTLKVVAAADAAAGEAQAKASGVFKLGDKDYPAPPSATIGVKVVP